MKIQLVKTLEVGNVLGESVLWDAELQCLHWTDIEQARLYRYYFREERTEHWPLTERLGSFGLTNLPGWFIGAFASGVALFNPESKRYQWLYRLANNTGIRFNDGRVDRQHRFWCGTMMEDSEERASQSARGQLFCVDMTRVSSHLQALQIPNGIAFSPAGDTLYFNDSPSRMIQTFNINEQGQLQHLKDFAKTPVSCVPDGSTVDADGYLWNAEWGSGRVTRYSVDGELDTQIAIPCPQVTSVSFAGAELNFLAITSAKTEMSQADLAKYPEAGHLFIFKTPYQGIAEERFAIDEGLKIHLSQPPIIESRESPC